MNRFFTTFDRFRRLYPNKIAYSLLDFAWSKTSICVGSVVGLAAHSEAAGPVDVFPSDGSPAEDPLATNEDSTIHSRLSNTQSQGPILPPQPKQIKIEPCTGHAVSPNSSPHTVGSQGRTSNFQDATLGSQNFTARLHESPPNVHIKSECDYEVRLSLIICSKRSLFNYERHRELSVSYSIALLS